MTYVALLRGINVGGKRRVAMSRLKALFEAQGCTQVETVIASGNVIFEDNRTGVELEAALEPAMATEFGFPVPLVVLSGEAFHRISERIPPDWSNDDEFKCDVLFPLRGTDAHDALAPEGSETVPCPEGALIWRSRRSALSLPARAVDGVTGRNCNTVRLLAERLSRR